MNNVVMELKLENLNKLGHSIIITVLEKLSNKQLKEWVRINNLKYPSNLDYSITLSEIAKQVVETNKDKLLITPKEQKVQISELISQLTYGTSLLTVEKDKIYGFYILHTDNTISEVDFNHPCIQEGWRDHCISPQCFHSLAKSLDCDYDNDTFAHICKSWVENYLDSDWTKLHTYLPK